MNLIAILKLSFGKLITNFPALSNLRPSDPFYILGYPRKRVIHNGLEFCGKK
jgi:hypothetical protein